eukprot:TRINITY_DN7337_c0_g1_i1.p1 TRINITY_DN7337_c0_g1~~TRINITY_DN7337_c0_g1_i1.p1  ORF type:complete len:129 (+),score=31.26 TRINITY_DN7337_c0_g1_i1:239-625(+)
MAFASKLPFFLRQNSSNHSVAVSATTFRFFSSRIFVAGLPYSIDNQTLKDAFSSFGNVTDDYKRIAAKIVLERETGRSRGFGFIKFSSPEDADAAITGMDGKEIGGRTIRVSVAQEPSFGGGRARNSP